MSKTETPVFFREGHAVWTELPGDSYVVTGVLTSGRRFPAIHCQDWRHARGINLYRGSKWLVRDGKRYLIQRVWN